MGRGVGDLAGLRALVQLGGMGEHKALIQAKLSSVLFEEITSMKETAKFKI